MVYLKRRKVSSLYHSSDCARGAPFEASPLVLSRIFSILAALARCFAGEGEKSDPILCLESSHNV